MNMNDYLNQAISAQRSQRMVLGAASGNSNEGELTRQSDVGREVSRLIQAADTLEQFVELLGKKTEKITRDENTAAKNESAPAPVPATMLGRDLDAITGRLTRSMNILYSNIDRIEL